MITVTPGREKLQVALEISGAPRVDNEHNGISIAPDLITVTIVRRGWGSWRYSGTEVEGPRVLRSGKLSTIRSTVGGWDGLVKCNPWVGPIVDSLLDLHNAATSPTLRMASEGRP